MRVWAGGRSLFSPLLTLLVMAGMCTCGTAPRDQAWRPLDRRPQWSLFPPEGLGNNYLGSCSPTECKLQHGLGKPHGRD